ncbi:hypothetical protein LUZ61_013985 [Rhynchospora tenuis]|uniref:DUF538 family protein n=1 Tax=Rhynchospora tenuis TaxID=198213 RepID=A0AAD5W9T1_9POAL|nr:hypothetical protein LUZ61_013985 [Rhynchospora tenuis]
MSPKLLLLLFVSLAISASASNPNPSLTAYDELNRTGFPIGLLPSGVLSYSLNLTSGDFAVDLADHCRITLPPDNYLAVYSKRITGKLVDRKISGLDGIRVRALFRWWSISAIRSTGDDLVFEVGVASAKYPAKNFFETPDCEGQNGKKASS